MKLIPTGGGYLTSQLFSNVYLNRLDQYVKRKLTFKHYGRYVDDCYIVSTDKVRLIDAVHEIRQFLSDELELSLHEGKIQLSDVRYGVSFLGCYVKPWRRYTESGALWRMQNKLSTMDADVLSNKGVESRLNSYIGVLSHTRSYGMLRRMMLEKDEFWRIGDIVRIRGRWRFCSAGN